MKIKQAKEYYSLGILTGFDAVRDPLKPGNWMLVVIGEEGRSWTLATATGEVKSFAKLDTLVGEVESIAGHIGSLHIAI